MNYLSAKRLLYVLVFVSTAVSMLLLFREFAFPQYSSIQYNHEIEQRVNNANSMEQFEGLSLDLLNRLKNAHSNGIHFAKVSVMLIFAVFVSSALTLILLGRIR